MSRYIVCTSINAVTLAVEKYDSLADWTLIVVGDLKTPESYKLKNGIYLSPKDQEKINKKLSNLIGWNCIQRRNFGLLLAVNLGAELVATVDDDNIPLEEWGKELVLGRPKKLKEFQTPDEVFDPIGATEYKTIWHRGFPLELINSRDYDNHEFREVTASIQANFWNGDPDIDAICRLEHRPECNFNQTNFPFTSNKLSPFNSQNTILTREVLFDYFLYPHIGRMDDIWASYYVQSLGFKVVYEKPTVYQDRNEHNLIEDMKKEYIGYEKNLSLVRDLLRDPESIKNYLPERTQLAWNLYRKLIE
jgi:hypothetical protein